MAGAGTTTMKKSRHTKIKASISNDPPTKRPAGSLATAGRSDDSNSTCCTSVFFNPSEGIGTENGRLVLITDGIAATEFDEPAAAETAMTPSDRRVGEIRLALLARLTSDPKPTLAQIAGQFGVSTPAIFKQWHSLIRALGMERIYQRASARARRQQGRCA